MRALLPTFTCRYTRPLSANLVVTMGPAGSMSPRRRFEAAKVLTLFKYLMDVRAVGSVCFCQTAEAAAKESECD
ncbi:hypothetical protein VZT92_000164 [Zoarces viviparus]|uniref:Uncharacterized protein n=1 Tax=Zoarces viviparus TaxID=48416 RepID=A0AAW1G858_ZOAVI